jgi:hypothetical protein
MQDILALMQIQTNYINQLYTLVITACADSQAVANKEFQDFTIHFLKFIQYQSSSMGFSQALDTIRVYHFALLELLLDNQIVAAAEQLELAITSLELAKKEPRAVANPQMIVLHYGLGLLEETHLKIITLLEELVAFSRRGQLQN